MFRSVSPLVLGIAVLTAGCRQGGDTVRLSDADSAGITFIRNGPDLAESSPRRLREILSIGREDSSNAYRFSGIAGIALDGVGQLYVADRGSMSIRKYAPDGHFITQIGRQGSGPGEFQDVGPLWITRDSIVVMTDRMQWPAAYLYHVDGRFLKRTGHRVNRAEESSSPRIPQLVHLGEQNAWVGLIDETMSRPGTPIGERRLLRKELVELKSDSDSTGAKIFESPPTPFFGSHGLGGLDQPLIELHQSIGFDATGMVYFSHGMPYRVEVRNPSGRLIRVVTRSVALRPVTKSLLDQAVRSIVEWNRRAAPETPPDGERMLTGWLEQRAGFAEPDSVPPTGTMLVSPDGSFWLNRVDDPPGLTTILWFFRYQSQYKGADVNVYRRWDTFDAFGGYSGYVELPTGFTPYTLRGNRVAGVDTDTLGLERAVVLQVE